MGTNSKIEWTGATWNPLGGCTPVSPGCANCYAVTMTKRLAAMAVADVKRGKKPGKKEMYCNVVDAHGRWNGKINLGGEDVLSEPLRRKKPTLYFVNSMSDLYHAGVPMEFIVRVFDVMRTAHWHTFQVLTKRAERLPEVDRAVDEWPKNVWQGVSVESQKYTDRIDYLMRCGARVKFLSCEPLLGALELPQYVYLPQTVTSDYPMIPALMSQHVIATPGVYRCRYNQHGACSVLVGDKWLGVKPDEYEKRTVDQVIAGGESGPNARPMHPDWARGLRDQCAAAGVPFLFKQWGEYTLIRHQRHMHKPGDFWALDDGGLHKVVGSEMPVTGPLQLLRRVGKNAAGRLLDGMTHDGMPEAFGVKAVAI